MKIRWEESVHKFGYLKLHLQDGTNRDATTEDLLLACKASGLVVVSAKHVEDMQKLKRECSESASKADSSRATLCKALDRCSAYEKQAQELRSVLGDGPEGESLIDAARRVVTEREMAKAGLRECALAVGLDVQPDALLGETGSMDQVLGYIRNAAREAKECAAVVKAAEKAKAQLSACGAAVIGAGGESPLGRDDFAWSDVYADVVELYSRLSRFDKSLLKARAERDAARACCLACAQAVGITYETDGRAPEAGPMDMVLGAIRAAVKGAAERDEAVEAATKSENLRVSQLATITQVDAVIVNRLQSQLEAAITRAEKAEALHAEAEGQIACRNELRARIAELEARAEKAEAELESARASASLVTMVGDIGVRNSGDATRLEAILAERDALAAELAAIRAATGEEPSDEVLAIVGVRTLFDPYERRRALYNLGRSAALGEVARMREEVATLRARVAELEAAPQGGASSWRNQLSNESVEFWDAVNAFAVASGGRSDAVNTARMNAVRRINAAVNALLVGSHSAPPAPAVASHVRAERPACLVARAVALGVDVRVAEDRCGWLVGMLESADLDEEILHDVPAVDVPATLSRLLDEVEAARKAVAK
jgi:hypothetical protein